jgi:hypothetical protein
MVEFGHILGDIELNCESAANQAKPDSVRASLSNLPLPENFTQSSLTGARARLANDLYASSLGGAAKSGARTGPKSNIQSAVLDFRQFLARLNDPSLSKKKLRALRREVAWRLHPDRSSDARESSRAMAELNARIDKLIAKAK